MMLRRSALGFLILIAAYAAVLLWMDSKNGVFSIGPTLLHTLPPLLCATIISIILRYIRWYWLMRRAGYRLSIAKGLFAYVSGFAFTTSPGKVGELIRIRYYATQHIPPSIVTGAFIYERALDLLCVLGLATLTMLDSKILILATIFVTISMAVLAVAIYSAFRIPKMLLKREGALLGTIARLLNAVREGFKTFAQWLTFRVGIAAWGLLAASFCHLLNTLGIDTAYSYMFSLYPLAILVGAASLTPGGIGSTEAVIVYLLASNGVEPYLSMAAAITIRVATLWFSVSIGLSCVFFLELTSRSMSETNINT